jgi:hypothetical protein
LPSRFFGQFLFLKKTSFSDHTVLFVVRCGPHELQAAQLGGWQDAPAADVMRIMSFKQLNLVTGWQDALAADVMRMMDWQHADHGQQSLIFFQL